MILLAALAGCSRAGSSATLGSGTATAPGGGGPATPADAAAATAAIATPLTVPAATAATPASDPTPGPASEPTDTVVITTIKRPDLRYRLVTELGTPLFCDPDVYPLARADEGPLATRQLAAIQSDTDTYAAITAHLGISPSANPTDRQTLAIYRDWKMLRAVTLTASGGQFMFDYTAVGTSDGTGSHVAGTIDPGGTIRVTTRETSAPPPCPICLARGTLIETPDGDVAVEAVQPGAVVWTTDRSGRRITGWVIAVGSTPVPATHLVVHLVLSDGRMVDASPGHPLQDGRHVGDLRPGDPVDGSRVVAATLKPYAGGATFDLLPSGGTGMYWANGIALGSTLAAN